MQKAHYSFERSGVFNPKQIFYHLSIPELFEHALQKKGIYHLQVHSVFSPELIPVDRQKIVFVDDETTHDLIDWERPINRYQEIYEHLNAKLVSYLQQKDVYIDDAYVGTDPENRLAVRFINEYAYSSIFVNNMF